MVTNRVLLVFTVLLAAALARAETWHVAADGGGDFTVIQDAVDAASDGDVIAIGPGRYDQYQLISDANVYVSIEGKQLTLVGAGASSTIIGPEDPDNHPWPGRDVYLVYARDCASLQISDIGFEHSPNVHVLCYADRLEMDDCVVRGGGRGVSVDCPSGGHIRNTHFADLTTSGPDAIAIHGPTVEFEVAECSFENVHMGLFTIWSPVRIYVRDCVFDGGVNGCGFSNGASGSIERCEFRNLSNYAVIAGSGPLTVIDNVIDLDSGWGMYLTTSAAVTVRDNIIATRTGSCLFVNALGERLDFRNNHLLRRGIDGGPDLGGFFAKTVDWYTGSPGYVDLSGNYWGTTDLGEIEEYIIDGHDLDQVNIFIEFEPIADSPVSTRSRSWNEVRELFRD